MTGPTVDVAGRAVAVAREGAGAPLVYLHGFADLHAAAPDPLPFHRALAQSFDLIAPAHPGCAGSADIDDLDTVHDVVEHYVDLADALGLDRFLLAGSCLGGWIAAELAVRLPERIAALALIGATGLFVSGQPIGDIFWVAQPEDGLTYNDLRAMLFAARDAEAGLALFPDGRAEIDRELLRYRMFRLASQIGFSPPYLHDRKLRGQLSRYRGPALVVCGEHDHMVPRAHAEAYAEGFPRGRLAVVAGAGHSVQAERPDEAAALLTAFFREASEAPR